MRILAIAPALALNFAATVGLRRAPRPTAVASPEARSGPTSTPVPSKRTRGLHVEEGYAEARKAFRRDCMDKLGVDPVRR